jgi:hypothetical protein
LCLVIHTFFDFCFILYFGDKIGLSAAGSVQGRDFTLITEFLPPKGLGM